MKTLRISLGTIGSLYVLVSACGDALGSGSQGWLLATVRASVDAEYQGTGMFHEGPDHGGTMKFQLNSSGTGSSDGQSLQLYRRAGGIPVVGVHTLAPLTASSGTSPGFTAYYHRRLTDLYGESFTAVEGEVAITKSSRKRVEGTFRITAALYCSANDSGAPVGDPGCSDPNAFDPSAPQVQIVGSFAAVPLKLEVINTGPAQTRRQ